MRAARSLAAVTAAVAGLGLALAGAGPASAASSYSVSLHSNHTSIDYGSSFNLTGKVSGGPVSGKSVTLYWTRASEDDTWHKLGTASLSSHGNFHRAYKPKFGGDIRFRAHKAATGAHHASNGYTGTSAVYQWESIWTYYANGLGVEDGGNGATIGRGTAAIDGRSYPDSVLVNDGAAVTFYSYQCKGVRGLVGVTSASAAGSGRLVFGPGGGLPFGNIDVARDHLPISFSADLDPDHTLRILGQIGTHDNGTDGGTANTVVLARPQLLCDAPA